jgi:hypothetical protein
VILIGRFRQDPSNNWPGDQGRLDTVVLILLDELILRPEGRQSGWRSNPGAVPSAALLLAQRTRPSSLGRVPHVRPGVLRISCRALLALANFMRLSLMKAAHAAVGGAPCRNSGYMGRKRRAQPLPRYWYASKKTTAKSKNPWCIE